MKNLSYADFHCHSSNSDGKYDVQEVINIARQAEIKYLALTDHNKVMSDSELRCYQKENPDMVLISGSEVSSIFEFSNKKRMELHIVALFTEPTSEFCDLLNRNNNSLNHKKWLEKLLKNLKSLGIDLGSYEEIQEKYFPGRQLRRMFLAELMTAKGFVSSVEEALDMYIGDWGERRAWEPCLIDYIPYARLIRTIHAVNGLAILAHPLNYPLNDSELQELLFRFKACGGDVVEVFYGAYSNEQRNQLKNKVDALGLGYSCGSDFHGFSETETMSHHFPAELYNQLIRLKKRVL